MDDVNERIRDQIRINRSLGMKGDSWDNYAVALIGTQHEVSGAEDGSPLSDATRDTLIRHNRQDVAHALANTTSILRCQTASERDPGSAFNRDPLLRLAGRP